MAYLVSILIPCHNSERWIGGAIESALRQDYRHCEVIVIDDGSTDASLGIIKSFGDDIRWETGPNRGGNAVRNRLLELARGDWLQYLDGDDYLLSDKISRQTEVLATCGEKPDLIFSPVTIEHWSELDCWRELLPIPEPHDPWVLLASWQLPQTGAMLWRKHAILDVGGWKEDQPCCQEHELYLRLMMSGKRFVYCPTGGAVYRQWSTSTVSRRDIGAVHRCRLAIEQVAENHLRTTQELTPRRQQAISQARFEIARIAWQYDRGFARRILCSLYESDPRFRPIGQAAPVAYRFTFRLLGFGAAETLAAAKRKVTAARPMLIRGNKSRANASSA
jgi:glycosyltransferase involved in cell wall biosynthesis